QEKAADGRTGPGNDPEHHPHDHARRPARLLGSRYRTGRRGDDAEHLRVPWRSGIMRPRFAHGDEPGRQAVQVGRHAFGASKARTSDIELAALAGGKTAEVVAE